MTNQEKAAVNGLLAAAAAVYEPYTSRDNEDQPNWAETLKRLERLRKAAGRVRKLVEEEREQ